MMAYYGARIEVWASDTRFVLDQLIREQASAQANGCTGGLHRPRADRRVRALGRRNDGSPGERAHRRFALCMNQDSDDEGRPYMPGTAAERIQQPFLFFVSEHSLVHRVTGLNGRPIESSGAFA